MCKSSVVLLAEYLKPLSHRGIDSSKSAVSMHILPCLDILLYCDCFSESDSSVAHCDQADGCVQQLQLKVLELEKVRDDLQAILVDTRHRLVTADTELSQTHFR